MCWASNHQNTYRNCPRAYFPFTYLYGLGYSGFSLMLVLHIKIIYDMMSSLLILMIYLWYLRGLGRFLECLSVRTCSLDNRPGEQCNHEGGMGCP
jgi:hypothetical protein